MLSNIINNEHVNEDITNVMEVWIEIVISGIGWCHFKGISSWSVSNTQFQGIFFAKINR